MHAAFDRLSWRWPDWWLWLLCGVGWLALVNAQGHAPVAIHGHVLGAISIDPFIVLGSTCAMMLPLIAPIARRAAVESFWSRRLRAVALTAAGYIGIWVLIVVPLSVAIESVLSPAGAPATTALTIMIAAIWQRSDSKRRAARACGFLDVIAAHGWQADRDCALLGARVGLRCATACWPLMAIVVAADHLPLVTVSVAGWMWLDRFGWTTVRARLRRLPSGLAFVFGAI